jgi:hypothetical protein
LSACSVTVTGRSAIGLFANDIDLRYLIFWLPVQYVFFLAQCLWQIFTTPFRHFIMHSCASLKFREMLPELKTLPIIAAVFVLKITIDG